MLPKINARKSSVLGADGVYTSTAKKLITEIQRARDMVASLEASLKGANEFLVGKLLKFAEETQHLSFRDPANGQEWTIMEVHGVVHIRAKPQGAPKQLKKPPVPAHVVERRKVGRPRKPKVDDSHLLPGEKLDLSDFDEKVRERRRRARHAKPKMANARG